ncbi:MULTISPECIES: bifunctional phosphoribosyl-AMP cyclohydrolase/phosphoribosyl-ATP diphosphatase HisIE [unclassified Candidatus Frackibacter]|uniref:bifunctional phosphoribosyl-AMP cyclohydrolase/phosphoribosyl-ATP diphosphatase HisIE n=1 Tax=unclassified Candidatus Frackibacter TaxID=2648818 RepID=UPI0007973160|nr:MULTISPECIES: bifunctional phosphoribosyl-AMP cyclohydrolase/phosphoribosyl-ATP diphosphatase HisIE [unclassified Candidatus Frackibacter]KXS44692.1 MAG: phosphoribosyl-ATP pyrophosphohydrolase / phosphoribosyl-AMP cyclohydrolase [Candidatus Frackibacter sp. T328-2]SDC51464.1 phosphoribosyl-ATP pyrophosphatase /phosphoribosyl-AMP cyclohydrolase [Candidatus Frackibacter sp. WG11]SEM40959.1 phosphoribosyl-ATP pyrophosphatase /phosphoribosyl-AMP cyclohydrolase [Candidatus Frackibacter sp. WG12]
MSYLTSLNFNDKGLIPAIIQDVESDKVLMMAYMNEEAVKRTIETGYTWFWSRSRQKLWRKGESSGHLQQVEDISIDCDGDTLLVKVKQTGGACHTGYYSCFYQHLNSDLEFEEEGEKVFDPGEVYEEKTDETSTGEAQNKNQLVPQGQLPLILQEIYQVVLDRKKNPVEGSYTCYLFDEGLDKILKKIGEEAAEVIIASKNDEDDEIIYEVSDLLYHLLVLLNYHQINLNQIYNELADRFGK